MSEARFPSGKVLAFTALVEAATGLALMIDPGIVVKLLVGAEVSGSGTLLGRCFGMTLFALGLACWPRCRSSADGSPALRAMFFYNAAIALYLAYLGALGHLFGVLLWPAVALHGAVALLLVWTGRAEAAVR